MKTAQIVKMDSALTRCSSSSFIVTLSLIRRTACARAQFSGCSTTTNANSETGQIAVCCQNLTLGALGSRSMLSVVGALFKKFGLLLNTPCIYSVSGYKKMNLLQQHNSIHLLTLKEYNMKFSCH
jgi:hypothetical protein